MAAGGAEAYADEYLRLSTEGRAPDLARFLEDVPEGVRDEVRRQIDELHVAKRIIEDFGPRGDRPEQPPQIPGFRIEHALGEGGLGRVYAAWDETLERRVALKFLRTEAVGAARSQVLEEARKAAALADPAIVTIHSITDGTPPAIVMELVEGFPIDRAAQALSHRQKAALLHSCARAIAVAHRNGIIHRDLKPANILVTPALQPKILDFGLAIRPGRPAEEGLFVGTPLFASPEQARGETLTSLSDIFSFGSVMFTVLAGRPPFEAADAAEVLRLVASEDPPFPRALDEGIPLDLQAICLACMAREREGRPTAADVAADLGRHLAGEPARLRPALYHDLLQRRIAEHVGQLSTWQEQGIISRTEGDRLNCVYRRILADEDFWLFDARRLSFPQVVLYATTWAVVVGVGLLLAFARDDLSALARWGTVGAFWAALGALGLHAWRRREVVGAAAFLAGAVLVTGLATLTVFVEAGVLAGDEETEQLFGPPFTNTRLFVSAVIALGVSVACWRLLRLTAFAWTTALLAALTWLTWRLTHDLLDLKDHEIYAWLLPLTALEVPALLFERRGRIRWALPFHLIALATLVGVLDGIAADGRTFDLLGMDGLFETTRVEDGEVYRDVDSRKEYFAFTLNGIAFMALMFLMERARSMDLRRGARILQIVVPVHLVGSLYLNAAENESWPDLGLYLGAVLLLLLLGPWRSRLWFLTAGLAGIALGSHLLLELDKVGAAPFTIGLALAGLVGALSTFVYLRRRSR